jgi:uncharacterized membrane protein affecting hemolysin expression
MHTCGQAQQFQTEGTRMAFEAQLSAIESSNVQWPPTSTHLLLLLLLGEGVVSCHTLNTRHRAKRSWSWPAIHWRQLLQAAQGASA